MSKKTLNPINPFKPGAGHAPPYLAGREEETKQFASLLEQDLITQNVVLTGLRGVGKTVLMDNVYKPLAIKMGWVWVGSDFSEAAFVDEKTLCLRLLTDLSIFTSNLQMMKTEKGMAHKAQIMTTEQLNFEFLANYMDRQPGLISDKLKATVEFVWNAIQGTGKRGVIFAYDEAQVVQDREDRDQYPLATLLETFQSIQKKGMRYMLLLTGLPMLFQKLVESRTYAERMFVIQDIGRISKESCRAAITKPLEDNVIEFLDSTVECIINVSKCYPYFIQYLCKESYDYFKSVSDTNTGSSTSLLQVPVKTVMRKLDSDFFSGRWSRITDRQRELLLCVASLQNAESEFTISEIVDISKDVAIKRKIKPFKTGDVGQMVPKLIDAGLLYKNRHGKYSLAVPLFDQFILRQWENPIYRQPVLF